MPRNTLTEAFARVPSAAPDHGVLRHKSMPRANMHAIKTATGTRKVTVFLSGDLGLSDPVSGSIVAANSMRSVNRSENGQRAAKRGFVLAVGCRI